MGSRLIAVDNYAELAARQIAKTTVPAEGGRRVHATPHHADGRIIGGAEIRIALRAGSQDELKIPLQVRLNYLQQVHAAIEVHRNRLRSRLAGVHEEHASVHVKRRLHLSHRWPQRPLLPGRIRRGSGRS